MARDTYCKLLAEVEEAKSAVKKTSAVSQTEKA
jgi:hypothetical protein